MLYVRGGGTIEIPGSKRVAAALGYEWHCVDYTSQKQLALLSEELNPYYEYTIQHDYITYTQNYMAVKELQENGAIPNDAVIMTGLCNDMPSGNYIPSRELAESYGFTVEGAAKFILERRITTTFMQRFTKTFPLKDEVRAQLVDEIKEYICALGLEVRDYQSFVSAVDCVETGGSHSRKFLHMNDIHEFFGHEWLLPCWDRELLKFWYSLPAEMRYRQNLYEEYVTGILGKPYGLTMRKAEAKSKSRVIDFLKLLSRSRIVFLGGITNPFALTIIYDKNNTAPTLKKLYRLIKQRSAVNYSRVSSNFLTITYMMEQRYGTKWFERIRKALN